MAKKSRAPERLKKAVIYSALAKAINRGEIGAKYYVSSPASGVYKPLKVLSDDDSDIVAYVLPSEVAAGALKFAARELGANEQFLLTAKDADATVAYWLYETPPVPMPKAFAWPGDQGLAFARLPWRPETAPTPTWDTILDRMSNREAFMAWLGSLFDEASYSQQYVWIHGSGFEGKGCINRFLTRVFGPAYCSKQPRERGDKFWTHELLGKRLVVFPDMDDAHFVASALFKSLTGGDPVPVEAKGQMAYTAVLQAKYLVFSNERPNLSSDTADKRRIIYCEIAPRPDGAHIAPDFEERLWGEGGAFLGQCVGKYQAQTSGPIISDSAAIHDWIETVEMTHAEVFDHYFECDVNKKDSWCPPEIVQRTLNLAYKSRKAQLEFLSWLERSKGIKKISVRFHRPDGEDIIVKRYYGLVHKQLFQVLPGGIRVSPATKNMLSTAQLND